MIPLNKDDICPEFYKEFVSKFEKKVRRYVEKRTYRKKEVASEGKMFSRVSFI